jgi:beta-lactamase regulating signal transducer with metallopeptidase domain
MGFLVELLVRGTIVLAVALALGSIPGLRRAELRGALLSVALLVMLALPVLVGAGAHLPVGVLPSRDERATSEAQTNVLLRVGASTPNAGPEFSVGTTGHVDGQLFAQSSAGARWSTTTVLIVLYALVAAAILSLRVAGVLRLRRVLRTAHPTTRPAFRDAVARAASAIGTGRMPAILESDVVGAPFVCGIRHPAVVLPAAARDWTTRRLDSVLLHEMAHIRRHDVAWRAVADVVCAVHWFNPVAWIASARLRSDAELACDSAAVIAGVSPDAYARELLALARLFNGTRLLRHAVGMSGSASLRTRIEVVLIGEAARVGRGHVAFAAVIAAVITLGFAVAVPVEAQSNASVGARSLNISSSGPEISSNGAGLQARWSEGPRHLAMFVTGAVDLSGVAAGRLSGTGRLVLIEERGNRDAGIDVFEWTPEVVGPLPAGVRRSIGVGASQLAALSGRHGSFPGSSLSGLPAWSDDPSAHVIQAGWLIDDVRFGLAMRGTWRAEGGALASTDPSAWLVLFSHEEQATERRMQVARRADGGLQARYFETGEERRVDAAAWRWTTGALDALLATVPPEFRVTLPQ